LGRSQNEESCRPRRDAWSDDTSWGILKGETHFGDCLRVGCWSITSPLYRNIAEFPIVQEHLKKQGACLGKDMILKVNQKPYINAGIFLDDIRTIFLPYIDMLRGLAVFA
jgi:hypothetical protein